MHEIDISKTVSNLIKDEASDLNQLASLLSSNEHSQSIKKAIQMMHTASQDNGRVIVIGIGKSGHIGAKIAATLASTGTPAFFAHPAELTHGDLGMITTCDLCLLISNSGETTELTNIIPHLKIRSIPLIAITSRLESTLAQLADVTLPLGITEEAGYLHLAPTSSTTATLALGDALAITLMEMHSFQKEDFVQHHPGGSLGKQLIRVNELMQSENLPTITDPSISYLNLIEIMSKYSLGLAILIKSQGKLENIITDGDLRRYQAMYRGDIYDLDIKSLIQDKKQPITIHADMRAYEALEIMRQNRITSLIVTNEQKQVLGLITIQAILSAGIV